MKPIIAMAIVGTILGGILIKTNSTQTYQAEEPVTVEKEIEVDVLKARVITAQEAAKEAIEAEAQKAYDRAVEQALLEIELEVTSQFRLEIEEREKVLQASSTAD